MMGAFNAGAPGGGFGGGGGGGGFNFGGIGRPFVNADGTPKTGQKLFSDSFTLKSDIGNPILRQTPIMNDGTAAKPVTWIEKGVLKNVFYDAASARRQKVAPSLATPNMSLSLEGSNQTLEDMIKSTRRGLLVTFFWYIRPVDTLTLLQTGMTRDGLFLIRERRDRRAGAELPLEHVAARRLREHFGDRQTGADSHRRGVRRPRHRARAAGPDRRFYMTSVSPAFDSHEDTKTRNDLVQRLFRAFVVSWQLGIPMSPSRRDFLKYTGAASLVIASSDLVGELIAQSPKGNPLTSSFKGLADPRARRSEARRLQLRRHPLHPQRQHSGQRQRLERSIGGRGRQRVRRVRGRGAADVAAVAADALAPAAVRVPRLRRPRHSQRRLGLRQQPDRQRGRDQAHHQGRRRGRTGQRRRQESGREARAGTGVHRVLVVAAQEGARLGLAGGQTALVQKVVDIALKVQGVTSVNASVGITNEWKYFASSEGSYIEQETFEITPSFNVSAKVGDVVKTRNFVGVPKTGGWEVAEEAEMVESAERIASEAVEMTTAKPVGMGLKDLVLMPAHAC
jgi:hypothetical protein